MSTPADMHKPSGPLCRPGGPHMQARRLPVGSPRGPFHKPGQTAAEQDVGKRRSRHGGSIRPERKRENQHIER